MSLLLILLGGVCARRHTLRGGTTKKNHGWHHTAETKKSLYATTCLFNSKVRPPVQAPSSHNVSATQSQTQGSIGMRGGHHNNSDTEPARRRSSSVSQKSAGGRRWFSERAAGQCFSVRRRTVRSATRRTRNRSRRTRRRAPNCNSRTACSRSGKKHNVARRRRSGSAAPLPSHTLSVTTSTSAECGDYSHRQPRPQHRQTGARTTTAEATNTTPADAYSSVASNAPTIWGEFFRELYEILDGIYVYCYVQQCCRDVLHSSTNILLL